MNIHRFLKGRDARDALCAAVLSLLVALAGTASPSVAADEVTEAVKHAHPSDESDPFPITVEVEPSLVVVLKGESGMAGRKVTIKGRTLAMGPGSDKPVRIAIDSDDPPVRTEIDATVGKQGEYANNEFAAVQEGKYTITATAPDGRGTATATLTAVGVPDLGERAADSLQKATAAVDETLDDLEQKIDEQPDSPAKTEAVKKLAKIRPAHKAFEQTDPAATIHGFFGAIQTRGALLEKQLPKMREIAQTVAGLDDSTEQLTRMQSELNTADMTCEAMAMTLEVAKAIGTVLSFEAKLTRQVAGMSKDVLADVASNKAKQPLGAAGGLGASFLVKNGKKLIKAEKVIDGTRSANGLMADFAAFATEQVFEAYCKRFVGPVDGVFTGKFYRMVHGKRTMWWKQSYKLSGRILLRYPRSATGKHIRMTGRIEGYAHSFDSWDDGMVAFDEKGITKGAIIAEVYFKPYDLVTETGAKAISQGTGALSAQVWGSLAGGLLPNSFAMHVRGEYDGDSISLLIGDRITDFTAATKAVNVVVSPLNTLGPTVVWYPLPYVDAHSVFAGGADDKPIRLPVFTRGKVMTAEGTVDNIENTKHAHGEYHLKFKLCNPGC